MAGPEMNNEIRQKQTRNPPTIMAAQEVWEQTAEDDYFYMLCIVLNSIS